MAKILSIIKMQGAGIAQGRKFLPGKYKVLTRRNKEKHTIQPKIRMNLYHCGPIDEAGENDVR